MRNLPMHVFGCLLIIAAGMLAIGGSLAEDASTVQLAIKHGRFEPVEVRAPANRPITLRIRNLDTAPLEFESVSLRVEKVVAPGREGIVNLRGLAPGRYEFFDDFHQGTRGALLVR